MKLIVGLGNPGPRYAGNRHNVGYMAIDAIAARGGFGPWRGRFRGEVAEGLIAGEKTALLKPGTFMNLSGQSTGEALRFYKIQPGEVIVLHDELDLDAGKCRLKSGGGHAGHNGLRSLHDHIGDGYRRLRIGIGHPGHKDLVSAYVLHDFAKADRDWLDPLLARIADAAEFLVSGDQGKFANATAAPVGPRANVKGADARPGPDPIADRRTPLQKLLDRFR